MEFEMTSDLEAPERSCRHCRYYVPFQYDFEDDHVDADYGECRRFPPKVVLDEDQAFPIVEQTCWCGEFDF